MEVIHRTNKVLDLERRSRQSRLWRSGMLGVACLLAAWVPPARTAEVHERDLQLTLKARQALAGDQQTGPYNIGVNVKQGAVSVWGRVPTKEMAQHVEELVQEATGVRELQSELQILAAGEFPADRITPPVVRPGPAVPAGESPGAAAEPGRRSEDAGRKTEQEFVWRPAEPRSPAMTQRRPAAKVSATGPLPAPLHHETEAQTPSPETPPRQPTLLPPAQVAAVIATRTSLATAVEALFRADPRFGRLRPEVQDKVVFVRGSVTRWEDAFELARTIARVPGVERVVLEQVQSD